VLLGAFFEIVLVIAFIGTTVVLYPIVKRQNDGVAQGYVGGVCLKLLSSSSASSTSYRS
jgi:hypothetical protein